MRSALNHSSANTAPTMSTIESSAPTSCRCTRSTGIWWMAASASASRWNRAFARSFPAGVSADLSMWEKISGRLRCAWCVGCDGCVVVRGCVVRGARGRGRDRASDCELPPAPVDDRGVAALDEPELGGRDTRPQHFRRGHLEVVDGQAAERVAERLQRQAGVEQRAEDHVPGRAVEAVEVENTHRIGRALEGNPKPVL